MEEGEREAREYNGEKDVCFSFPDGHVGNETEKDSVEKEGEGKREEGDSLVKIYIFSLVSHHLSCKPSL